MKKYLNGVVACSLYLFGALHPAGAADSYSYRLILDETLEQAWVVDVAPKAVLKSTRGSFRIRDKVAGKNKTIDKQGSDIGINEYNMIDFCIETKNDPICREIIISDFSYEGLATLLLGGRGERLKYIVLAACERGDRDCRYPHLKLGPNPVLALQKEGIRAHYFEEEGREFVVAGPYPPTEVKGSLQKVQRILPGAFIR